MVLITETTWILDNRLLSCEVNKFWVDYNAIYKCHSCLCQCTENNILYKTPVVELLLTIYASDACSLKICVIFCESCFHHIRVLKSIRNTIYQTPRCFLFFESRVSKLTSVHCQFFKYAKKVPETPIKHLFHKQTLQNLHGHPSYLPSLLFSIPFFLSSSHIIRFTLSFSFIAFDRLFPTCRV